MPVDISNVTERLKKFILQHPEMSKNGFIRGLNPDTGKIIIVVNGSEKYITIDELESGHINNNASQTPVKEEIEVMEEPTAVTNQNVTNNQQTVMTLKDISEAAKNKNAALIDKALSTFAIDSNTGNINMSKAIVVATDNSTKNVVACVRDNKDLPVDLSAYDIMGNMVVNQVQNQPNVDVESLIQKSFEVIKVFVEVARLKNIVFSDKQIADAYNNYSKGVHKKLQDYGLEKKENNDNVVDLNEYRQNKNQKVKTLTNELLPDKKAGFADVIILTIIVLIYAAIIINLVSKLN